MTPEQPDPHHGYLRPAEGQREDYEDLVPLEPLDLSKIDLKGVSQMLEAKAKTPFRGREVGEAVETLTKMALDPDCCIMLTMSGALTAGELGLVITDLIDAGIVQDADSTGAFQVHGAVESAGRRHFWALKHIPDPELNRRRMNRIDRSIEPEDNLDFIEEIYTREVMSKLDPNRTYADSNFNEMLGEYLFTNVPGRGILKSAYEKSIPLFIPSPTDSELGLNAGLYNRINFEEGRPPFKFNPYMDLDLYTELIRENVNQGKKLGIITLGGGAPRNWAQQVGPYIDILDKRAKRRNPNYQPSEPAMFSYAVRICPDDVGLGGLSGCTYEEGMSWGKFWPDVVKTEVLQDANVVLADIVGAALYRLGYKFDRKPVVEKNVYAGREAIAQTRKQVDKWYGNVS